MPDPDLEIRGVGWGGGGGAVIQTLIKWGEGAVSPKFFFGPSGFGLVWSNNKVGGRGRIISPSSYRPIYLQTNKQKNTSDYRPLPPG